MDFSYSSYEKLISLLKQYNYSITDYNNYKKYEKSVILILFAFIPLEFIFQSKTVINFLFLKNL